MAMGRYNNMFISQLDARRKAKAARVAEEHASQMAQELTNEQQTRDALTDQQGMKLENSLLKDAIKVRH